MNTNQDLDRELSSADPAQHAGSNTAVKERAALDLQLIMSTERTQPAAPAKTLRWTTPRLVSAGLAAAVVGGLLVVQPWSIGNSGVGSAPAAIAAEPAMLAFSSPNPLPAGPAAAAILAKIAGLTETAPDPDYMKTTVWSKSPEKKWDVHSKWTSTGPDTTESWLTQDGHYTRKAADGKVTLMSKYWGFRPHVQTAARLHTELADWVGATGKPSAAQIAFSITGLNEDHTFNPAVRAAMIDEFAHAKGVVSNGDVVDRAGRHGVAFTGNGAWDKGSYPQRETLIFDPNTGQLLSSEEWVLALEANGPLFNSPMVTGYTIYEPSRNAPAIPAPTPDIKPQVSGFQKPAVTTTCSATDAETMGDVRDFLVASAYQSLPEPAGPPAPPTGRPQTFAEAERDDAIELKLEQWQTAHPAPPVSTEQNMKVWFDGARQLLKELPASTPNSVRAALTRYTNQVEELGKRSDGEKMVDAFAVDLFNQRNARVIENYLAPLCG